MLEDPQGEQAATRLQPYIDELREFLTSRGVPTGKPADIASFAARIAEGDALEEELGSILRSVVYRESERMGRGELLEMLTSAVGGPDLDGTAPGMQANVRTIFLFLGKALRQQRPSYTPEREAGVASRPPVPPAPTTPAPPRPAAAPIVSKPLPAESAAVQAPPPEPQRVRSGTLWQRSAEADAALSAPPPEVKTLGARAPEPAHPQPPAPLAKSAEAPRPAVGSPYPKTPDGGSRDTKSPEAPRPAKTAATAAPSPLPTRPPAPSAPASPPSREKASAPAHPFSPWVAADAADDARSGQGRAPTTTTRPPAPPSPPQAAAEPQGNALYRALNLSTTPASDPALEDPLAFDEDETPQKEVPGRHLARTQWLVPAVAGVLMLLGLGVYIFRHNHQGKAIGGGGAAGATGAAYTAGAASCTPPSPAAFSRSGLDERSRWAHNLLDQKLYEAALPELREIARMDPSFPGIRLDESQALLNLKRPDEAREAVDAQISISQCLARLPQPQLSAYCSLHYPATTPSGCQMQIAHIRQQAELQAALVHLELGHRAEPDDLGTSSDAGHSTRKASRSRRNTPSP